MRRLTRARSTSFRPRAVAWVVAALVLVVPGLAHAHPLVDEGVEAVHNAQFEAALDAFARAAAGSDLTQTELETLLAFRALAFHGLLRPEDAAEVLRQLASLAPGYDFAPEIPPDVREIFERQLDSLPGRVGVSIERVSEGPEVRLRAHMTHDDARLLREIRIGIRRGEGEFVVRAAREERVTLDPGEELAYFAVAIGAGGAVIAEAGSALEPFTYLRPPEQPVVLPVVPAPPPPPRRELETSVWRSPWLWIGIGVVAAGITTGVVLATEDRTAPGFEGNVGRWSIQ